MRIYVVHRRARVLRLVPDGLSFWAFLFGPVWLLYHRAWLAGLVVVLAEILLRAIAAHHPHELAGTIATASRLTLDVAMGLFGNDLRRLELRLGGFLACDRVAAPGPDHALLRHLDRSAPGLAVR